MPSTARAAEHTSAAELDRPEPTSIASSQAASGWQAYREWLLSRGVRRAGVEATLRDLALNHEVEPDWLWMQVGVVGCEGLKHALVRCMDVICP